MREPWRCWWIWSCLALAQVILGEETEWLIWRNGTVPKPNRLFLGFPKYKPIPSMYIYIHLHLVDIYGTNVRKYTIRMGNKTFGFVVRWCLSELSYHCKLPMEIVTLGTLCWSFSYRTWRSSEIWERISVVVPFPKSLNFGGISLDVA